MAEKASLAKLHVLQRKLETAQKRVAKIRDVADEKVEHLVRATEVAGSAFAIGAVMGKFPQAEKPFGIPLPLLAAVGFHTAGLVGIGGDMKGHLHAFGDGALAAAAFSFGKDVGVGGFAALKNALPGGARTVVPGQRLTDEELKALSNG